MLLYPIEIISYCNDIRYRNSQSISLVEIGLMCLEQISKSCQCIFNVSLLSTHMKTREPWGSPEKKNIFKINKHIRLYPNVDSKKKKIDYPIFKN